MKSSEIQKIRELSAAELEKKLQDLKEELFIILSKKMQPFFMKILKKSKKFRAKTQKTPCFSTMPITIALQIALT